MSVINSEEYKEYPIRFQYSGAGTLDFAREQQYNLYQDILQADDPKLQEGVNIAFVEKKGQLHGYDAAFIDLYNFVRFHLFQSGQEK